MPQSIHQVAIETAERAIDMMDDLLRDKIDLDTYALKDLSGISSKIPN
jgi:hypothetical protein